MVGLIKNNEANIMTNREISKVEYELLLKFKNDVIEYVDWCDKKEVILSRNYFIKIINEWVEWEKWEHQNKPKGKDK